MPSAPQTPRPVRRAARAVAARAPRIRRPEFLLRRQRRRSRRTSRVLAYLSVLGPGLIIANAGNDAGGIFTYTNTGAKYGTALLWCFLPILVCLVVVQEMVARLGAVTGKGLMDLIREKFGIRWTLFAAIVVIVANGGTTLAEFAGVAGGLGLVGVPRWISVVSAALLIGIVVLRGNRRLVERVFLAFGLAFISYVVAAFTVHPDWATVGRDLVVPNLDHGQVPVGNYIIDIVALIGTSITPYMQLSLQSLVVDKGTREEDLPMVRADVISGSVFAVAVAVFIVVVTAATLFTNGHTAGVGVDSAQTAAQALEPLAGSYARGLFAVGLIGASLLAAAVLPLSTAFVVCEAFGAERSVQSSFREAPLFFSLFIGILVIGAGIMLIPGVPITGVAIGTQFLDGILLPVLLVFILMLANDRRLLGDRRNGPLYNAIAGFLAVTLSLLTAFLLVTTAFPSLVGG